MSTRILLYVSGAPATGKSSLMRELTAGCDRLSIDKPFAHDELYPSTNRDRAPVAVELGRQRPDFPGTDTLSMGVAPLAYRWISDVPSPLVLAEGDRLATMPFLEAANAADYTVHLVHLYADPAVLQERSTERFLASGKAQNPAWRKGRATKASSLAGRATIEGWKVWRFDTAIVPTGAIVSALHRVIPELHVLPSVNRTPVTVRAAN